MKIPLLQSTEEDNSDAKRCRPAETNRAGKDAAAKPKTEQNCDAGHEQGTETNAKRAEPPKDYIHFAFAIFTLPIYQVRREKISERMKLLQDLVPGCNKVSSLIFLIDGAGHLESSARLPPKRCKAIDFSPILHLISVQFASGLPYSVATANLSSRHVEHCILICSATSAERRNHKPTDEFLPAPTAARWIHRCDLSGKDAELNQMCIKIECPIESMLVFCSSGIRGRMISSMLFGWGLRRARRPPSPSKARSRSESLDLVTP
ncbi:hypothetical protein BHE74_00004076 [Ensete ventricosum]|nr:hypothetical protein GW17_00015068 [Ensete ventricosum]RWW87116.1 hypothetical protein BHE74_00004076 [Ensete ventricosum]RZR84360.1 hypothetical protein BHM03_00011183 [Ensete ventricosum]